MYIYKIIILGVSVKMSKNLQNETFTTFKIIISCSEKAGRSFT